MICRAIISAVLSSVLTSGCAKGASEYGMSRSAPIRRPPQQITGQGAVMTPQLQAIVQAARADAARRTGYDTAALNVTSAEAVIWPDSSLGCPEPGMMYAQALVPGYRIRIQAGSELLDYHASARGRLVLCPPARATDPLPDDRT